MQFPVITLELPHWINDFVEHYPPSLDSIEERMKFVVAMARKNVETGTGGPFAAAVFCIESGQLIAPGVNIVVQALCSMAHAEMMALSVAQNILKTFDLGSSGSPGYELVTSTAPCAMCLGAIPWSGVRRIICGARDEDARNIGFDEGSKVTNWIEELRFRDIEVILDVCREQARDVLNWYKESGGVIYNSRQGMINYPV